MELTTTVQYVKGVGPRFAPLFAKLGIEKAGDLLRHVPRRYEDRTHLPRIGAVRIGETVTIRGSVWDCRGWSRGGMRFVRVTVGDTTGAIDLVWFNQPWLNTKFQSYRGEIVAYGMVREGRNGLEMNAPDFELVTDDAEPADFGVIVPVYPSTEGLPQSVIRRAVERVLTATAGRLVDPLPKYLRSHFDLPDFEWSLRNIHRPDSLDAMTRARRRLVFEEFLGLQLALQQKRSELEAEAGIAFPIADLRRGRQPPSVVRDARPPDSLFEEATAEAPTSAGDALWAEASAMFPFELTGAQRRVVEEVWADMERPSPMNRLLQGDVGSGKTAVAACAILAAVRCGYQCALMAPTEILAEQHFKSLSRFLAPRGVKTELFVGKRRASTKADATRRAREGLVDVAVGTHALIQDSVSFDRLGLVIVDEQHRFGVLQRAALRDKGVRNPDVLAMTATPIPRTAAMAFYGDMDLSILDEMPPGRKPIVTHVKTCRERPSVYKAIDKILEQGRQAYVVCPLIAESEKLEVMAAEEHYSYLTEEPMAHRRLGLLHGQMKAAKKEEVMERFRNGELDVLVATVVIEVGVDVPNATVMIIEDAHRFGLAQLHQLRGRVGRGADQSYCVLIADPERNDARRRLQVLASTEDGFKIAEEDFRMRGPGEIAGTRQHGGPEFQIGDLREDGLILEQARSAAIKIVSSDPLLERRENAGLRDLVSRRWSGQALIAAS